MQEDKITVVFESDILFDGKIKFEKGKEYQFSKITFRTLFVEELENLTLESFWRNIKFISDSKLVKMNEVRQPNDDLKWPPSNKCFECLVYKLVAKHANAAFEYLKAKNRGEVKNSYKQWKNWIKDDELKNSLDVGKDKLKLLYPEKKDYFDGLSKDKLQQEIDDKLLLGTQYDKRLKYGVVLDDKNQAPQVQKIAERLEDELYKKLLEINRKYIDYFSPDFLYRKIILEKSNDGQLNDFQKAFIEMWTQSQKKGIDCPNIIDRMEFGFHDYDPEQSVLYGWELCKFVCEFKIKAAIEKFQLGQQKQISEAETKDLKSGLLIVSSYLHNAPKNDMYAIVFHNNGQDGIDCTIKKIVDLFTNHDFCLLYGYDYNFFYSLLDLINVAELYPDDERKKNILWLIGIYPYLINRLQPNFIIDNLDDENVWYALCNFYEKSQSSILKHFINEDGKVMPDTSKKLMDVIEKNPNILHELQKEDYTLIYPLITKSILNQSRFVLRSLQFMDNHEYFDDDISILEGGYREASNYSDTSFEFWANYFAWLEKNSDIENNKNIKNIGEEEQENSLIEVNTRAKSEDEHEKNSSEGIISVDNDKIGESKKINKIKNVGLEQIEINQQKFINNDDLKKIILTRRYMRAGYQFCQEDYWNFNINDFGTLSKLLEEKSHCAARDKQNRFSRIDILQQKYVQENNLEAYANKMEKFDRLVKFERDCSYSQYKRGEYGEYNNYLQLLQDIEECDPNYPGLMELKSYSLYLIIIHWLMRIALVFLSAFVFMIFSVFLFVGIFCTFDLVYWLWFGSFLALCGAWNGNIFFVIYNDEYRPYNWAEKLYLNKRLRKYDTNLRNYRTITDLFEKFIDEKLCFIGDNVWNEIKNYFKNNVATLESELKKYRKIDDFKKITVDDVYKFFWKRDNKLISEINKIFDNVLDEEVNGINEIAIGGISRNFIDYVNSQNNSCADACEKFINKNIVGHLDDIKEMLKIRGRRAYFRHKPNTNKKLIEYDISLDLSELLWETLKKEHEKDKNIQENHLNTDKKNESVNDNKPIVENEEEEINTSSQQNF